MSLYAMKVHSVPASANTNVKAVAFMSADPLRGFEGPSVSFDFGAAEVPEFISVAFIPERRNGTSGELIDTDGTRLGRVTIDDAGLVRYNDADCTYEPGATVECLKRAARVYLATVQGLDIRRILDLSYGELHPGQLCVGVANGDIHLAVFEPATCTVEHPGLDMSRTPLYRGRKVLWLGDVSYEPYGRVLVDLASIIVRPVLAATELVRTHSGDHYIEAQDRMGQPLRRGRRRYFIGAQEMRPLPGSVTDLPPEGVGKLVALVILFRVDDSTYAKYVEYPDSSCTFTVYARSEEMPDPLASAQADWNGAPARALRPQDYTVDFYLEDGLVTDVRVAPNSDHEVAE